jgi:hypothetical protein
VYHQDGRSLIAAGLVAVITRTPKGENIDGGPRTTVWDLRRNEERFRLSEHWLGLDVSADGRFLATGWGSALHYGAYMSGKSQCVGAHVWETASGQEVWRLHLPKEEVTALAFAPDGKRLAVGQVYGKLKTYELKPEGWQAPGPLTADNLNRAWQDLAGKPRKAYAALWTLTAAENKAVDFLKGRLKSIASEGPSIARLVADLDSPQFKVREEAFRKLAALGNQIEPDLERALKSGPSQEVRRRLEKLLAQTSAAPSPERLREDRALAVLERVGNPAALAFLKSLANSAPRGPLTEQARAALQRLERRFAKE